MQYIELALLNQRRCCYLCACSAVKYFYSKMAEEAVKGVFEEKPSGVAREPAGNSAGSIEKWGHLY